MKAVISTFLLLSSITALSYPCERTLMSVREMLVSSVVDAQRYDVDSAQLELEESVRNYDAEGTSYLSFKYLLNIESTDDRLDTKSQRYTIKFTFKNGCQLNSIESLNQ